MSRRRPYEARDVAAAAARMARALVRRAATGDQEALYELSLLETQVRAAVTEAGARYYLASDATSWSDVAVEFGISRQAARQRFAATADQLAAG